MGKYLGPFVNSTTVTQMLKTKTNKMTYKQPQVTTYVQMRNTAQCSVSTSQVPVHAVQGVCVINTD